MNPKSSVNISSVLELKADGLEPEKQRLEQALRQEGRLTSDGKGLGKLTKNITGQKFGRLTAMSPAFRDKRSKVHWLCRCDCGKKKVFSGSDLRSLHAKSCGCLQREESSKRLIKHGHAGPNTARTRIYKTWAMMKRRCFNTHDPSYLYYGARGITVCDRWCDFRNFLADMGDPPSGELERVDNNGNYEKSNCRWATRTQQNRNKRNSRLIMANGVALCLAAWAEKTGIDQKKIWNRLKAGWSSERAVGVVL